MFAAEGDTLRFRLEDRKAIAEVSTDDFAIVLAVSGELYRIFRVFQSLDVNRFAPGLFDTPFIEGFGTGLLSKSGILGEWLEYAHTHGASYTPLMSDLGLDSVAGQFTDWVEGLYVEDLRRVGSWEIAIKAFGSGAGEGIASALRGFSDAVVTLITSPAEFKRKWAEAKQQDAEAKIRLADARAQEARVDTLEWALQVLQGVISVSPEVYLFALEVAVKNGAISQEGSDELSLRFETRFEALADLGEQGILTAD